jgi:hypothetical protein
LTDAYTALQQSLQGDHTDYARGASAFTRFAEKAHLSRDYGNPVTVKSHQAMAPV